MSAISFSFFDWIELIWNVLVCLIMLSWSCLAFFQKYYILIKVKKELKCQINCIKIILKFLNLQKLYINIYNSVFILFKGIIFLLCHFLFFAPRHKYFFKSHGMNITVRNMEIDLNSNIPQLMLGVLFFQGGTVRQYISAVKYMIILKPQ